MITLTVRPDGAEPYVVVAHARDVLTWEKTTKGKTFLELMANPDMPNLYKLAHLASWRQGLYTGTLQEFEQSCDVVFEEDGQEPEPDPTQQGPSTGPSSPSPSEPESPRRSGQKKANARS